MHVSSPLRFTFGMVQRHIRNLHLGEIKSLYAELPRCNVNLRICI
jgi:hypothetical protein